MPTSKPRETQLDLTRGSGEVLSLGLTPFTERNVSEAAINADGDNAVANLTAYLTALLRELGEVRKGVQSDHDLSAQGKRAKFHQLAEATYRNIVQAASLAVGNLAARINSARENAGGLAKRLSGEEFLRLQTGTVSGSAFDPARAGTYALIPGILADVRAYLLDLARNGRGEQLNKILNDAAHGGDFLTWASIDLLIPEWMRIEVLGQALINEAQDRRLHQALRAKLDPERAAAMGALAELGRHVAGNMRAATQKTSEMGHRPGTNEPGLDTRMDDVLRPLTDALRELGDVD